MSLTRGPGYSAAVIGQWNHVGERVACPRQADACWVGRTCPEALVTADWRRGGRGSFDDILGYHKGGIWCGQSETRWAAQHPSRDQMDIHTPIFYVSMCVCIYLCSTHSHRRRAHGDRCLHGSRDRLKPLIGEIGCRRPCLFRDGGRYWCNLQAVARGMGCAAVPGMW
jgi:hypothetical protein